LVAAIILYDKVILVWEKLQYVYLSYIHQCAEDRRQEQNVTWYEVHECCHNSCWEDDHWCKHLLV